MIRFKVHAAGDAPIATTIVIVQPFAWAGMREQFSTISIPEPDRLEFMHRAIGRLLGADIGVQPMARSGVEARMSRLACGPLELIDIAGGGYRTERRGSGRPDWVSVMVQLEGVARLKRGRTETRLVAGDVCVVPPVGGIVVERPQRFHQVLLDVPRPMLDEACPGWLGRVLGRVEAQRAGARCLSDLLRLLLTHETTLDGGGREHLALSMLGLLERTLADARPPAPPPVRAAGSHSRSADAHRRRVQRHVLEHLRDPELSVPGIAAALQLSPRYVHKLFEGEGTSLMRWVQAERLHACRRELAERGTRTIGDVAFDWGFNHPSHFSRAYRRLFGVAPSVA